MNSVNTVYAQLVLQVGPAEAVDTVRRMGIPGPAWMPPRSGCSATETDSCRTKIDPFPALSLGSEEVTPLEMASAFGTLAARGVYHEPKVVSKVTEADGTILEEGPSAPKSAIDEQIADNVNDIMQGVVTGGTGTRAAIGRPSAGKTGTAQDFQNAWYVGYTPELSTSVWVGFKDANKPLLNIQGQRRVTGGSIPAQIWASYMEPALGDAPVTDFPEPEPLGSLRLPPRRGSGGFDEPSFDAIEPFNPEPIPFEVPRPPAPPPQPPPPPPSGGGLLSDLFGRIRPDPTPPPTATPAPTLSPSPSPPPASPEPPP